MAPRQPDECHHFQTRTLVCEEHGAYRASVCGICEVTVVGFFHGILPPCARHWHPEND